MVGILGRALRLTQSYCWFLAVTAFLGLGGTTTAQAALVQFASFTQAPRTGHPFVYTDEKSTKGDAILDATSVHVIFNYNNIAGLPVDLQGDQDATLTMTSSTRHRVTGAGTTANPYVQDIDGGGRQIDRITITRNSPAAEGHTPRTLLLELDFAGALLGRRQTRSPTLSGDTSLGDQVTFTSDFLDFSLTTERDFDLIFAGVKTKGTRLQGDGLLEAGDKFFRDFTAAASGAFSSEPRPSLVMPEPSSLALAGLGLFSLLGVAGLRKWRRS